MSVLVLTGCGWFVVGWVIARTILQQQTWFGLIPSSMALGIVLHTALLNALLYVTDTASAFWGSGLILVGAAVVLRGFLPVQPLELGLSRRQFILLVGVIMLIWAGLLPPVLVGEYYDNFHHQALAGVIAHSGNPPMHPFSPPSCSFYHYGVSAMAGGLFSVTHLNFSLIFDLLVLWSVFSLLWLLVFTAYHLLQKPSIVAALLAMGLFLTYASANWLAFPLTIDPIRQATQDIGGLDYFRSVADATQEYRFGTLSFTSFTWIYAQVLHMRNNTLGLLCTFLIVNLLRTADQPGRFSRTLLIGLLLGVMPLFDETAWPVTGMLVGFYHLYRWWQLRARQILMDLLVILVVALPIAFLQGGVLTDTFFCDAQELSAYEGRSVTTVHFPAGPGYFVWHPPNDWIRLAAPENWPRFLADWGFIVLIYPFLLYHYLYKRREALASCLLLATSALVFGFLLVKFDLVARDTSRAIANNFWIWAFLMADWLAEQWRQNRRLLVLMLIPMLSVGGLFSYYNQFTTHLKDAPPLQEWPVSFISDIDREVQQKWFGKIGSAEDDILALSSEYLPPIVFGNYTPTYESRNALAPLPDLPALRRLPDPQRLRELGVRYLYYDEAALNMLSDEGRDMLDDSGLFIEVFRIEKGESVRILYRLADEGE